MILACYELVLAFVCFINMSSYCGSPCHAMYCSMVSGTSSPTCLLVVVPAMFEPVNETCYVYMGAIISSDPFWLMVSKELLLYALSRFMPCLDLP